tara:strand:+ start:10823 stop:11074 length:252 start_codon:yes stop_codon:yes gene_type:complete
MKHYNWRNKQTSESKMEELVFKFFDITNNILSDNILIDFKNRLNVIRNDYYTLEGQSKVYTDEQLEQVKTINKICRQIAKLNF